MLPTVKQLSEKIATIPYEKGKWTEKYLTKKDCNELAGRYKQFIQFTNNTLNDFANTTIHYSNGFLHFNYDNGSAKIGLDVYEYGVLMPAIEDVAAKYGKQIIND